MQRTALVKRWLGPTTRREHRDQREKPEASFTPATGVLMALRKVTPEDAFTLLRAASQRLHRKLRDVAPGVLETGALPAAPTTDA
jgi:AmiR/NasT family two-component response regulator